MEYSKEKVKKNIMLFGAGTQGKAAALFYGIERVAFFVDNNNQKIGKKIFGIEIIDFDTMIKYFKEDEQYRIIITTRFSNEIAEQLKSNMITTFERYLEEDKRRFFSEKELVVNRYEKGVGLTEELWNTQIQGNPLKKISRDIVNEWIKTKPCFKNIEIETINRCNGHCSFCPVNADMPQREKRIMSLELFNKIVRELRELDYRGRIALYSNNEPLLDERIIELYSMVKTTLPNTWVYMFTNAKLLTMDKFIKLTDILDELIIDNYNDELELMPNVKVIKEYCEQNINVKKKVTIVLRKENEILTSRGGDAPNRLNKCSFGDETCALPFQQMVIRPDGKVSLCCNDPLGKNTMGDLNIESLLDVWYGVNFNNVRDALQIGRKEVPHCIYCDTFQVY